MIAIKMMIIVIMLMMIILTIIRKVIVIISSCYRTVPSAIWEIFSEFLIF